jgi:hypothetical protein
MDRVYDDDRLAGAYERGNELPERVNPGRERRTTVVSRSPSEGIPPGKGTATKPYR